MKKLYTFFLILAVCACGGGDDNDAPYNSGGNNNGGGNTEVAITGTVTNIADNSAEISGTVYLGQININYSSIEYGAQGLHGSQFQDNIDNRFYQLLL